MLEPTHRSVHHYVAADPHAEAWEAALAPFTELHQPADTHFGFSAGACSRIDRIYATIPPWALLQLNPLATVYSDPQHLYEQKISDRAPVGGIFFVPSAYPPQMSNLSPDSS